MEGLRLDRIIRVSEMDAVLGGRRLLHSEAILAGGSSGAVMAALSKCDDILRGRHTVVVVLPDTGERYLDTIYDDRWVADNIGVPATGLVR